VKITAFNGSPRGKRSNTDIIVQAFLAGAQSAGAEVEDVYLVDQDIHHCNGCFSCWFKTPGRCVFVDDMQGLLEKYMSSDFICYATPVYTWNMTAMLKNFADRLIPLRSPVVTQSNEDYDMKARIKSPEAIVISNCGFPGENNFDTVKAVFKCCNPILEIYRNCGMALQSSDVQVKARVDAYLEDVKEAGCQIVRDGKVSDAIKTKLQMELVPTQDYLKMLHI
jgi:multimeric flavodoxin WrbA